MSKEGLSKYEAHRKRISFIEKAIEEGVLEKISTSKRNQNVALVYNLNDEITAEDVGKIFPKPSGEPLFRQHVNQISKHFLAKAWSNSSPQLQSSYPLKELLARKPNALSPINARIKKSILEEGASPTDIKNTEGAVALASARILLRKYGIDIPFTPNQYDDFKTKVETETDDKKLQELLESPSLRHFINMQNKKKDDKKILTSLSQILREGGFYPHKNMSFFMEKLKVASIPSIGIATDKLKKSKIYWLVLDKHQKRIIDTLKDDPDLQKFRKNPIQIICGNSDESPTTYSISHSKQYSTNIREIIKEITGYKLDTEGYIKVEGFLFGCPVPVFKHQYIYAYPTDMAAELKAFLRSKKEKT